MIWSTEESLRLSLISNIYFCLYADKQEIEYEIIRSKIVNPHITIKELMEMTGTSNATIYNYLHAFADVKMLIYCSKNF